MHQSNTEKGMIYKKHILEPEYWALKQNIQGLAEILRLWKLFCILMEFWSTSILHLFKRFLDSRSVMVFLTPGIWAAVKHIFFDNQNSQIYFTTELFWEFLLISILFTFITCLWLSEDICAWLSMKSSFKHLRK